MHSSRSAAAAPLSPPDVTLAGLGLHAYDASVGCTAAAWEDIILNDDLVQGTSNNQPAITSAGLLSYAQFDGSTDRQVDTTVTNFGGAGGFLYICVAEYLTAAAAKTPFCGSTSGGLQVGVTGAPVGGFTARFTDATGADDMVSLTPGDTARHIFIIRCEIGVSRKFYVDGGAGVSGARTSALVSTTRIIMGAGGAAGASENAHCRVFYGWLANGPSTLANINALVGPWAVQRFGVAWSNIS